MIKMQWERIEPWEYIVTSVASEYARYYSMCDLEDIRQTLYEWFLKHPRKLTEWENLGNKDAKNLIYRSLRNQALDYCQYWKAKSLGYETEDLFFYTPEMIETLLPAVLLDNLAVLPVVDLGSTGKSGIASEGNNMQTMLAEISKVYAGLSGEDKQVLIMRFQLGYEYPEIVDKLELNTEDAARQRVRRAIKRIINKLGGYKPQVDEDFPPGDYTLGETFEAPEEEVTAELE